MGTLKNFSVYTYIDATNNINRLEYSKSEEVNGDGRRKRKEYTMKKRVFAIVPTIILCILLFYLIKPSQSPKSPYQNSAPVSGFSIQAVQAQYTIDTKQISLCITNHSDNSPELYLPYLEQNINETWVIVKKSPHIRDTDNLLYIPSGETMNVDFFLTDYDQLSVGKYRIIFGLAHSNDFFYFPFDIVDS